MKLEINNNNYAATIVKIHNILPLDGCDNVCAFPIFWMQAIVSRDQSVWCLWILFPAECQLSDTFCKENNLYREKELNKDVEAKWYIEKNRRVKAVKFRWHMSSSLFMPLESLSYLWINVSDFNEWDSFEIINWIEVCKKYYPSNSRTPWQPWNKLKWKEKRFEKIDNKVFPEHLDSDNYFKNSDKIYPHEEVIVTQKLHGTSGRFGFVKVRRKLKRYENILQKIGIKIDAEKYDYIYWSRRVIKNWFEEQTPQHYYSTDVWKETLERIKHIIPKGYIIYWEVIWWEWWKPIQVWYTYSLPQWSNDLYIYRISIVNEDGYITDLSYDAICEFCKNTWLNVVPLLWKWLHGNLDVSHYMDINYYHEFWPQYVKLDTNIVDEWVIIRREGIIPYLLKAKCQKFLLHESKQLDEWIEDLESSQS